MEHGGPTDRLEVGVRTEHPGGSEVGDRGDVKEGGTFLGGQWG